MYREACPTENIVGRDPLKIITRKAQTKTTCTLRPPEHTFELFPNLLLSPKNGRQHTCCSTHMCIFICAFVLPNVKLFVCAKCRLAAESVSVCLWFLPWTVCNIRMFGNNVGSRARCMFFVSEVIVPHSARQTTLTSTSSYLKRTYFSRTGLDVCSA